ncbi:lipid-transfer protein [Streptomyces sp. NPDC047315]|uniref:lipid-transfer protein n=1 Tax=Streptomyces sp. NPDC047315 TaxID=3155142 RepID=UPI0033EC7A55
MGRRVLVAGVGMIPFAKPGKSDTYNVMGERAIRAAVDDAGIDYGLVQQAYAGYVYGDSTSGQAALYSVGITGIPVVNVNNNCATGSTALWLAKQAVEAGIVECAIAVGFEQMRPGALVKHWIGDRPSPTARFDAVLDELHGIDESLPRAAQLFGGAGMEYVEKYGADPSFFAKIAVKSRTHAAHNPYSVFRTPITEQEVLDSPHIYGPVTRLQACPPTCGAGAAILCSEEFARRHGLSPEVAIKAQAFVSDTDASFEPKSMIELVGAGMTRRASQQVYETAGVDPKDIEVVELHDCFTVNEALTYEALGLCEEGGAEKFVRDGRNTYGGQVVVGPSGGLMSKGHPLGATGLAQCTELVWQLRGRADARQVEGATLALQHNLGLGGVGVVTLYEKVS